MINTLIYIGIVIGAIGIILSIITSKYFIKESKKITNSHESFHGYLVIAEATYKEFDNSSHKLYGKISSIKSKISQSSIGLLEKNDEIVYESSTVYCLD
jgi:H+/gluconate symporter-like permease